VSNAEHNQDAEWEWKVVRRTLSWREIAVGIGAFFLVLLTAAAPNAGILLGR
jgi:hypothetical protein